jgi:hypothetical protein
MESISARMGYRFQRSEFKCQQSDKFGNQTVQSSCRRQYKPPVPVRTARPASGETGTGAPLAVSAPITE